MKTHILTSRFPPNTCTGAFWLYGLLAIASFVFAYALVPKTKERTLEEIEKSWRFIRRARAW